jgi:hypothetical protein
MLHAYTYVKLCRLHKEFAAISDIRDNPHSRDVSLSAENQKEKEGKKDTYALTGFSCAIFHIKKNPRASITVRTLSA